MPVVFLFPQQAYTDHPSWQLPYQAKTYRTGSFSIADLAPATWYQVRVIATNEAGSVTAVYNFATKNEDGSKFTIFLLGRIRYL